MTMRSLLACGGLLALLTGCGKSIGTMPTYAAALTLAMPPVNTVIFGCDEEFAMPEAVRKDCELHYHLTGRDAPWEVREKYLAATAYQPGELQCTRTLGQNVDCAVVSGPPHSPPWVAAPNNLGSE